MCIEDLRIARRQYGKAKTVSLVAGVPALAVGVDLNRTKLIVSCVLNTGLLLVRPAQLAGIANSGIQYARGQFPVTISIDDFGELCQQSWEIESIVDSTLVTIFEVGTELR